MTIWKFERKQDGTIVMWIQGEEKAAIPASDEAQLIRQMNANGIFGESQASVLGQLAKADSASVEVPTPGRFSQF